MRNHNLHLVAMAFFVFGFVFASSGWSLVLTQFSNTRPDWSVCGQDMCYCLPSTNEIAYCPLCDPLDPEIGESSSCVSQPDQQNDSPTPQRRVPDTKKFETASSASQAGCASIFLSFLFGTTSQSKWIDLSNKHALLVDDKLPQSVLRDIPEPPPRA